MKNKLCVTIGVVSSNLLVAIMYALHVCSPYFFGLPLRMNEMYRMQSDHARFDHYLHVPLVT